MTDGAFGENRMMRRGRGLLSLALLGATLFFGIALSAEAAQYVKEGFALAAGYVIPASFPFMLISDAYVAYGNPENILLLKQLAVNILGIPQNALAIFISGNVGGFPIGAKAVSECYCDGGLTREEAERLLPLCNNPSSAFVVGGVGLGIFGDVSVGILLLISVYIATVVCALLTKSNCAKCDNTIYIHRQKYSFIESVKKSGWSCVSIFSFICAFSVAMGIIKKRVKHAPLTYMIFAFSEVTNAVRSFAFLYEKAPLFSLALAAFSLGFGGLSVGLQSSVFASASGLKMRKYYGTKLLEGLVTAAVFSLLFSIKTVA